MPYPTLSNTVHSTDAELDFIKNLGTNTYRVSFFTQEWHLKKYINNAHLRWKWGHIDNERCVDFARELLRQVGG